MTARPDSRELTIPGDWTDDAACKGHDTDLWFATDLAGVTAAAAICADCPVRRDCQAWADSNDEAHGIWGGWTPPQRRNLARGRKPGPAITVRDRVCIDCGGTWRHHGTRPPLRCPDCRILHHGVCTADGCDRPAASPGDSLCRPCENARTEMLRGAVHGTARTVLAGCWCSACRARRRRGGAA